MKFPRNARILRSPFELAPFASVFFLLAIFLMVGVLLPTPGLPLQLPAANRLADGELPGTGNPTVSVAIAAGGQFYFAYQSVDEKALRSDLAEAVKKSREQLTLLIYADKSVTLEQLVRMTLVAREAGIYNTLLATLPRSANLPTRP